MSIQELIKDCPDITGDEQLETFIIQGKEDIKPSLPIIQGRLAHQHVSDDFKQQPEFVATLGNQAIVEKVASNGIGMIKAGIGADAHLGTAFFVSPTVLVTAKHNLYVKDIYTRQEPVQFSFSEDPLNHNNNAPIQYIALEDLDPDGVFRALAIATDPKQVADSDPNYPEVGLTRYLDFAFLRSSQRNNTFLLPQAQANPPLPVVTVGYPAPATTEDLRVFVRLMEAFGARVCHKHLAPGTLCTNTGRIFVHNCSTLKGVSGGPVINPANGHFIGVHTTGPSNDKHAYNLGFSVDHPIFKILYKKLVFPTLDANSRIAVTPYLDGVPDI